MSYTLFLVFGNFASIIAFLGLLVTAPLLFRHSAATHKRLVILASISIIGPVLARISRWPGLGGEDNGFIPIVFSACYCRWSYTTCTQADASIAQPGLASWQYWDCSSA